MTVLVTNHEKRTFGGTDIFTDVFLRHKLSILSELQTFACNPLCFAVCTNCFEKCTYCFENVKNDLNNHILRTVGNPRYRIKEDSLRILRCIRFATILDFDIEPETFAAMAAHAPLLEKISVERSFIEFDKLTLF